MCYVPKSCTPPPPITLQEWYHFVQGNDTNQNRGVPIDLLKIHYAIWAIFKMATFEMTKTTNAPYMTVIEAFYA